ncbi:potassium channel family protein [Rhodococcus sp. IEGM 1379]|uniref:potassium channel family protein n=1 Tax=Rhodococcus sp. IEGM 1379 TaxID=3047086 RepID=UPI0024B639B4|nr:potassium channel family protein [Rhodococcus sp. IEGM 1379]MDI9918771.1 ion channel [Rhodococcus sp. IEGM 1379]
MVIDNSKSVDRTSDERVWTSERWQSTTDMPLIATALFYLFAYAFQVLVQPAGILGTFIWWSLVAAWAVFTVDYLVRLSLASNRWNWFVHHLLDLAMVVLPMFRPLRLLRLVTLLAVMHRSSGATLRGRVVFYAISATALLIGVAALAMLDAERHADGSEIRTYGQALWWAIVTVTTVGYGDISPVTVTGRVIAASLMIGGIALLGIVTATLASWLLEQIAEQDDAAQSATRKQVADLAEQVRLLAQRSDQGSLEHVGTKELRRELERRELAKSNAVLAQ